MRKNHDVIIDWAGTVNVLLESRVVLQGQIINGNRKPLPVQELNNSVAISRFLVLRLTCDASILRDNAQLKFIEPPLYQEGNIVRVNLDQVLSIGPSSGCPEEEDSEE